MAASWSDSRNPGLLTPWPLKLWSVRPSRWCICTLRFRPSRIVRNFQFMFSPSRINSIRQGQKHLAKPYAAGSTNLSVLQVPRPNRQTAPFAAPPVWLTILLRPKVYSSNSRPSNSRKQGDGLIRSRCVADCGASSRAAYCPCWLHFYTGRPRGLSI